ncbi:MAG TPA: hypothetical protein VHS58_13590 [Acetobacteraceae bacterium]|nr:hypothetical protein [Acetobacteraceae bacterium]
MSDWVHGLPLVWMTVAVFGFTYLTAFAVYLVVLVLAGGERADAFKAIPPGLLSPVGIIFGLFIGFTALQVWTDVGQAEAAVANEASALRSVIILASSFPGEHELRLRSLVRDHIEEAATREWPMMARRTATLSLTPRPLAEAIRLSLSLPSNTSGEQIAQREIVSALEHALDARRQRIIISRSQVGFAKWGCLFLQVVCVFVTLALLQCDNRLASAITLAICATGVAASVVLVLAYDRPFTGEVSVQPARLLEVLPGPA